MKILRTCVEDSFWGTLLGDHNKKGTTSQKGTVRFWSRRKAPPYGEISCELRAPEDFLKRRYNLLDMSAMRVAYYGLDSLLFSL